MMYPYNGTRLMPDYPTGFTPDATTAAVVPGLTYQPLPAPNGMPRGNFDLGPYSEGSLMTNPYGGTQEFFDGATLWNRNGTSDDVKKLINGSDFGITQLSQWTQWQQGLTPYPPNFSFPAQYPAFPGTPANPYGSGAELGLAGLPYAAGYGAAYPGAVNNAVPFNRGAVPQQQQQQRPAPPSVRT
ncbi:MAG: hypothetical protein LW809_05075 [Vampirovibrionales bacterium]|nr:hypothetical protein [Vampirovibrionales bacterium]